MKEAIHPFNQSEKDRLKIFGNYTWNLTKVPYRILELALNSKDTKS